MKAFTGMVSGAVALLKEKARRQKAKRRGRPARFFLFAFSFCLSSLALAASAATLQVGPDETYPTIQSALDACTSGDVIIVADGYYNTAGFYTVDLKGKNVEIRSKNGPDACILSGPSSGWTVFRVHTGETRDARISGFTMFGSVSTENSSPTIEGNVFLGCRVNCFGGSPLITNNVFLRFADKWPIACNQCTSVTISGNSITDCGAGIQCISTPSVTVVGNRLIGNRGTAIWCYSCATVEVAGNMIAANVSTSTSESSAASGIRCYDSTTARIVNNVVAGNSGHRAIAVNKGTLFFANNTIAFNAGGESGGGLSCGAAATVLNSIFWGNTAGNGSPVSFGYDYTAAIGSIDHCCIEGGKSGVFAGTFYYLEWGSGNIESDPLFVDAGRWLDPLESWPAQFVAGDYRLRPASPCVDAGGPADDVPATDYAGRPRSLDGDADGTAAPDVGAYEYPGAQSAVLYVDDDAPMTRGMAIHR